MIYFRKYQYDWDGVLVHSSMNFQKEKQKNKKEKISDSVWKDLIKVRLILLFSETFFLILMTMDMFQQVFIKSSNHIMMLRWILCFKIEIFKIKFLAPGEGDRQRYPERIYDGSERRQDYGWCYAPRTRQISQVRATVVTVIS